MSETTPAPTAMVLADPAACKHRRIISNQYAEVGTKASPTHDKANMRRQAAVIGLLPTVSESVPHNMGAR